jgi:hypothetical protein
LSSNNELKAPGTKLHSLKEIERLCKLGVLEQQQASEWALPSFIVPKKDKSVCFLSNVWEVNKRLVRKPFPIPKISTILQELEGFSYAIVLDLNIGYYTIRLGQSSHHHLPLGEIFLQEITDLHCKFSQNIPREIVRANRVHRVCMSLLR